MTQRSSEGTHIECQHAGLITLYKTSIHDHGMGRVESILFSVMLTVVTGGIVYINEYDLGMHMAAEGIDLD